MVQCWRVPVAWIRINITIVEVVWHKGSSVRGQKCADYRLTHAHLSFYANQLVVMTVWMKLIGRFQDVIEVSANEWVIVHIYIHFDLSLVTSIWTERNRKKNFDFRLSIYHIFSLK